MKLSRSFKQEFKQMNEIICREGQQSSHVYLLRYGRVQIEKSINYGATNQNNNFVTYETLKSQPDIEIIKPNEVKPTPVVENLDEIETNIPNNKI